MRIIRFYAEMTAEQLDALRELVIFYGNTHRPQTEGEKYETLKLVQDVFVQFEDADWPS